MAKPMFFYAGVYDSAGDAEGDLEAIKGLHDTKAIGSYDSADRRQASPTAASR